MLPGTMPAGAAMPRFYRSWARHVLGWLDETQLVTWEHRDGGSRLLHITNVWPHQERPDYGPFVADTVDTLRKQGLPCDVMFIRGYRSPIAYLAGALAS